MKYCLKQNSKHEGENENNFFLLLLLSRVKTKK
jgi:hypothetical protein